MIDLDWMLLALSGVVLASYLFDLVSHWSRIPSVVMLIASGIGVRLALDFAGLKIDFVDVLLPVVGTLGLVLIVLDGALELRLTRQSRHLIYRAALTALIGIGGTGFILAACIQAYTGVDWLKAWVTATPFAVISSAVAIPAAASLRPSHREHVVYESALSDIFGVLLFYALLDADKGMSTVLVKTFSGIALSSIIGATLGLLMVTLVGRIVAHVRFVPMIFSLVAAYAGSKLWHLAPLVTVLAVGLILNNIHRIRHLPLMSKLIAHHLDEDVAAFKHLTAEITFIVRTFFFVLLGYSTALSELADPIAWAVTIAMLLVVFACRAAMLRGIVGPAVRPLVWYAPRGLITVLLYINIPQALRIEALPQGALMLTVLGSIVIMTMGNIADGRQHDGDDEPDTQPMQERG